MNLPLDEPPKAPDPAGENSLDPEIPKALRDLMETYHVDEWDVENVVEGKGMFRSAQRSKITMS